MLSISEGVLGLLFRVKIIFQRKLSNATNNKMGKTRVLFRKIKDTKGTFNAKMGSIKDRNGMDLTEAKKRWKEYKEELYKKRFSQSR